jgi:N-acetylgalactosamine-6-sulfatase
MSILGRRSFLKTASLGAAAVSFGRFARAVEAKNRPNIIFILTDDMGWGDPKCFGHPFMKTPNIDRIAKQGTIFTQFYVNNPVCSPSRTAFMTGHFPARHRVHQHFATARQNAARNMPNWLDPDVTTVTKLLKKAGYATGHFGKWHLSSMSIPNAPLPDKYGIDDSATRRSRPKWRGRIPYYRAKSTGLFVDETLRFIRACKGKPFYVNLWTLVPHATLKPTPEELKVYEDLKVNEKQFTGYMRKYLAEAPELTAQMKVYCAAVTGMDKALGRLFDELEKMGLAENTLIFFTSDNGPEDYHVRNASNAGAGSPGVFRGRKRSLYEGGVRTSLVVRWPARVKASRRDEQSVITGVDWLPTVCKLAGVDIGDIKGDGEDVSDILTRKTRPRKKAIFWEWRGGISGDQTYRPPKLAVREGKWKFFVNPDGSAAELYDIPADSEERTNLAKKHPDTARRLKEKLLAWKKTLPK